MPDVPGRRGGVGQRGSPRAGTGVTHPRPAARRLVARSFPARSGREGGSRSGTIRCGDALGLHLFSRLRVCVLLTGTAPGGTPAPRLPKPGAPGASNWSNTCGECNCWQAGFERPAGNHPQAKLAGKGIGGILPSKSAGHPRPGQWLMDASYMEDGQGRRGRAVREQEQRVGQGQGRPARHRRRVEVQGDQQDRLS